MKETWLKDSIIDGISTLILLRLQYAPAMDTIAVVSGLWLKIFQNQRIGWDEELDAWRVNEAFLTTAGEVENFPSPSVVLKRLPRRKQLQLENKTELVYTPMPQETRDALDRFLNKALVNRADKPESELRSKLSNSDDKNKILKALNEDLKLAKTEKQRQHIQTIIDSMRG